MNDKVKKAIERRKINPYRRAKVDTKCPLMCWDVASMFRDTSFRTSPAAIGNASEKDVT